MTKTTQAVPHVKCVDVWAHGLPEYAPKAYIELMEKGELGQMRVVTSKKHPMVILEYFANCPHEFVLDMLKSCVRARQELLDERLG